MKHTMIRIAPTMTLVLALGLLVASCSTTPPPRPPVEAEPAKESYQEGSLWPGKSEKNMFFADNKANSVGDIVTVHVIEKTVAVNQANTADQSTVEDKLTIDTGGATATRMTVGGGNKYSGKGSTGRSDKFQATVSCVVREVLPNGNMMIEGQRRMQINNEEQYILVRGMIRATDITYNNTVLSTQMAMADIEYTGGGAFDSAKRPNWLGSVMRTIWPF